MDLKIIKSGLLKKLSSQNLHYYIIIPTEYQVGIDPRFKSFLESFKYHYKM